MKYLFFLFPFLVFSQGNFFGVLSNQSRGLITGNPATLAQAAFPTAEGFGKNTTGGRGGTVIHVTNLNNSGAGSLREALLASGTRTIVFDVGGTIQLTGESSLQIGSTVFAENVARENVTVLGNTAPSPGISIRGGGIEIYTSNVILRYLTIRSDIASVELSDALRVKNWGTGGYDQRNIIIDHVSLSHGSDENLNFDALNLGDTLENVTIQNSLLGESDGGKNHLRGNYVYNLSYIGNYLTESIDRNPLIGYGSDGETAEFINNVVYGGTMDISRGNIVDVIGNIYKQPSNFPEQHNVFALGSFGYNNALGSGAIHGADNYLSGPLQAGASYYNSEWTTYVQGSRVINNSLITSWLTGETQIENRVLPTVGNSLYRDSLDANWVTEYNNDLATRSFTAVPIQSLTTRAGSYDTDNDGMADSWEIAQFGNLDKTAIGNDLNAFYTNIEMFSFSLTGEL